MSVLSSSLKELGLENITRLTLDRARSKKGLAPITHVDITKYRGGTNVINFLTESNVPDDLAKAFHGRSTDLAEEADRFMQTLSSFGLKDYQLKEAWKIYEKISAETRELLAIATDGFSLDNFKKRFIEFTTALSKLVFKDVMLDEIIDTLKTYFKPA